MEQVYKNQDEFNAAACEVVGSQMFGDGSESMSMPEVLVKIGNLLAWCAQITAGVPKEYRVMAKEAALFAFDTYIGPKILFVVRGSIRRSFENLLDDVLSLQVEGG